MKKLFVVLFSAWCSFAQAQSENLDENGRYRNQYEVLEETQRHAVAAYQEALCGVAQVIETYVNRQRSCVSAAPTMLIHRGQSVLKPTEPLLLKAQLTALHWL